MFKPKLFSSEPIKSIEDIILQQAIPKALSKVGDILEKENCTIPMKNITQNIPTLISEGMSFLRSSGEEGKKIYELADGCIIAAFLNHLVPQVRHDVCYPEDNSYDFLIVALPRDKQPDFNTPHPTYKNANVFKVELTEAKSSDNLMETISNKLSPNHDYKGRILLVALDFTESVDFAKLSDEVSQIKQDNFHAIWLMRHAKVSIDPQGLYYLFVELIKHKKVYAQPFRISIDWTRIEQEVNQAITNCKICS